MSKSILYVDDDLDDWEILTVALTKFHPEVHVLFSENGMEALHLIKSMLINETELPCLIVLDLNMPYIDGRQTFDQIREIPAFQNIPIVIFTSSENPNDKALFKSKGVEMLTKPYHLSFMDNIIDDILSYCKIQR